MNILDLIKELKELEAKATPGPWKPSYDRCILTGRRLNYLDQITTNADNCELAAQSRNALPKLLEFCEEAIESLSGAFHHNTCPWLEGGECCCANSKVQVFKKKWGIE